MPDIFINEAQPKTENKHKVLEKKKNIAKTLEGVSSSSLLSSYCVYPENIKFETQEHDEKIILLLRQHPIVNIRWILIALAMFLVPSVVSGLGVFSSFPFGFGLVMSLAWYLVTVAYVLESFLSWYFNVYFVTDRRIIDVDFFNIIYKQVSDAQLDKIQDLTYNMGGVVRTIFNYGNVFIQTAGEVNEFEFMAVPYPDKVAKIIQDLMTP